MQELGKLYERSDIGPLLYIRHAQSIFNIDTEIAGSEDEARHMKEYLDCRITETGKQQAEKLSKQVSTYKIKFVFCSPMLRCLQTCFHSLKNHLDRENIRVFIHPLITETVNCNHDYSRKTFLKKKEFNLQSEVKFDWSLFDQYFPNECEQETYFLDYVDTLREDPFVSNLFSQMRNPENYKNQDLMDDLATQMSAYYTDRQIRPESIKKLFYRNLEFKEFLATYIRLKGGLNVEDDEKVLVYSHSNFIQTSNSKMAYELERMDTFPEDSYKPYNCEVITMFI